VVEIDRPDISKYDGVVPNGSAGGVAGLVSKPDSGNVRLNLASISRDVLIVIFLTPDEASVRDLMRKYS